MHACSSPALSLWANTWLASVSDMTAPAQVLQQQTGAAVQEGARRTGLPDQPPFGTPGKHRQARLLQKPGHGQVSGLPAKPVCLQSQHAGQGLPV